MALSDYSPPNKYELNDILKPVRDSLSRDEILYALPIMSESSMTFYRKDLFKKAGIIMPLHPTYDEIMKFAKLIHDPDNAIYGIGLRGKAGWGQNMAYISTLINTYGGRWFDENWSPQIDTPEWKEALSFYKDILSKYGHPDHANNGWKENQQLFSNGNLGILIDGTAVATRLYKSSNYLTKLVLPIPLLQKQRKEQIGYGPGGLQSHLHQSIKKWR